MDRRKPRIGRLQLARGRRVHAGEDEVDLACVERVGLLHLEGGDARVERAAAVPAHLPARLSDGVGVRLAGRSRRSSQVRDPELRVVGQGGEKL
jgi:hypothetical protein